MMARLLYTALWLVVLPLALVRIFWRGRAEPGYRYRWTERFATALPNKPLQPLIWLHAVSLGETRAAEPLIEVLFDKLPAHHILLTHSTATGRAQGKLLMEKYPGRIMQSWLPYDLPWYMRRFMVHFQPALMVVMETEVWPNLMHTASQAQVPVALVNARLSEKSARQYARWPALTRATFASFTKVFAQTSQDAQRLKDCGALNVQVMGNVKFDMTLDPQQTAQGKAWREAYAKPVVIAASTREGEEALLLQTWKAMDEKTRSKATLMIVPRHPQRFDEVAELVKSNGFMAIRRSSDAWVSAGTSFDKQTVLLGDSLGEMAAYYAMSDVCIMGGSLLNYGSQNLIEACAAGCPVVLGNSTYNFAQAAADAIAAGAAVQPTLLSASADQVSAQALLRALELACSPAQVAAMRQAGQALAQAHQGASLRQALALTAILLQAHPSITH
jgi:3-deoxy-D-manno-octulosonic-acid transferase